MSFTYNPFLHIELVMQEDGYWHPYCHGCGHNFPDVRMVPLGGFQVAITAIEKHMLESHKKTPADLADWSRF
jgi:hypothetical protein